MWWASASTRPWIGDKMGDFAAWRTYFGPHRKGQYEAAMAGYTSAGAFDAPTPRAAYGVLLLRFGRFDEALAVFDDLLKRPMKHQARSLARINRALCRWKLGHGDEALDELREVLSSYRTIISYGCLGFVLLKMGQLDEALRLSLEGLDFAHDEAILDNLGQISLAMGDVEAARKYFEEALDRKENMVDAHYLLGTIAMGEGALDEAERHLNRAMECPITALTTANHELIAAALADCVQCKSMVQ